LKRELQEALNRLLQYENKEDGEVQDLFGKLQDAHRSLQDWEEQ
jgi:hypothetical protein